MAIKALKCPNCGGVIESFDEKMNKGFCPFCDSIIVDVQDRQSEFLQKYGKIEIEGTVKIDGPVQVIGIAKAENILKNAHSVFNQGNYNEAYRLYTEVLNVDPDSHEAIFYRGCSSAWQSTIENNRIEEMMSSYVDAAEDLHKRVGNSDLFFEFMNESISVIYRFCHLYQNLFDEFKKVQISQKNYKGYSERMYNSAQDSIALACENAVRFFYIVQPDLSTAKDETLFPILKLSSDVFSKKVDPQIIKSVYDTIKTVRTFDERLPIGQVSNQLVKNIYRSKGFLSDSKDEIFEFKKSRLLKEWEDRPDKMLEYQTLTEAISKLKSSQETLLEEKKQNPSLPLKRRIAVEFELGKIATDLLFKEKNRLPDMFGL